MVLAGQGIAGSPGLADLNGNALESGQDVTIPFQVNGIDGVVGATASDDAAATAQQLGDLTSSGLVQVAGAIGDDPFVGANQVDLYHFTVSGPGTQSLTAEVFAGRIGSWLTPGVSLFRLDPVNGNLDFVAGDVESYNSAETTDGQSAPLYSDSLLSVSLTAGDYYVAVADGYNTPSPLEGQTPGSWGIYDPNQPGSAQFGWPTGPYVLNLHIQPAPAPPQVVSTSPNAGATLDQTPTQLVLTFNQPMNFVQAALQSLAVNSQDTTTAVYIEGSDGTVYFPRFVASDAAADQATFLMLDALPDGEYRLHLSGAAGLVNMAGIPLAGNVSSGDYVVPFSVDAPRAGPEATHSRGPTRSPMMTSSTRRISASCSRTSSRRGSRSPATSARILAGPRRIRRTSTNSTSSSLGATSSAFRALTCRRVSRCR